MNFETIAEVVHPLLAWYRQNARVLPWRSNPEPYRVWVSEIMLQQTRVEAVREYFKRFMEELPSIEALASAPEEQYLKLWEGLGYYSRVRNLHKAAVIVMEEYGGRLPSDPKELEKLPGIGAYTAGAIASIAYGVPAPAVDGNVLRVIARVTGGYDDVMLPAVKRSVEDTLRGIYPPGEAGDFTQALMELGALVCVPNGPPKCLFCPLQVLCIAHQRGIELELPVKTEKQKRRIEKKTVFLIRSGSRMAIVKRPEKGLLASLWELPNKEGTRSSAEARALLESRGNIVTTITKLPAAKHIFTHVEWRMTGYEAVVPEYRGDAVLASAEELRGTYTLPAAFKPYLDRFFAEETNKTEDGH